MTNIPNLLRLADPLTEGLEPLDAARDGMRRTVTIAALGPQGRTAQRSHRRAALTAGVLASVVVLELFTDFGNRGTVQAAVRFEVRLAEAQPLPGLIVARVADSSETVYLHPDAIVTNDDVAQSWVTQDGPESFIVSVQLLDPGARRMQRATANHIGRPAAIVIDGHVVMAPTVRSEIGATAAITGGLTRAEAERIAAGITP